MNQTKVAISDDFMMAFAGIPRNKQKKVMEFVTKFRSDPRSPGINYEKIKDAKNQGYRSVRIDRDYRGIILKPEQGNVFILLWVDKHDAAYTWAARHTCQVHPDTGTLQIYEALTAPAPEVAGLREKNTQLESEQQGLISCTSEQLLKIGVPHELIPTIQELSSSRELEGLNSRIPVESFEALYFLSEGMSWDEVVKEYQAEAQDSVDTTDISTALERQWSQRRFHVVEDELELIEMLNAPLERWRVFLHPSQRRLVHKNWNGPVRVLGGAGTGKTVVAMHRAKWLASNVLRPGEKVLFTTFTTNLAIDIQENLKKICSAEELSKIEVKNIDKWVREFLKRNKYPHNIVYENQSQAYEKIWDGALGLMPSSINLPESFYREEWSRVVLPQRISKKVDYFKASRVGRGVALNRKQRNAIWPVFEEVRSQLHQSGMRTHEDATLDASELLQSADSFLPYRSVVVDEAQDMGPEALTLIRQIVPEQSDDLFLVGDAHQRIYRRRAAMSQCGIKIVGRSRKLRINYRTTEETRRFAAAILEGLKVDDLDGGEDSLKDYRSLVRGEKPDIRGYRNQAEEIEGIAELVKDLVEQGVKSQDITVVARTRRLRDDYATGLNAQHIATYLLEQQNDDREIEGVRVATMHRVKGLEFRIVIIAGMSSHHVPLPIFGTDDPVEQKQHELNERALVHVASSRAQVRLFVTYHGQASSLMQKTISID